MTIARLSRLVALAGLLSAIAAPALHRAAAAADPATSNKGGEVRGTTRADDRAGAKGDQGRDRAEANKTKAKGKGTTDAAGAHK